MYKIALNEDEASLLTCILEDFVAWGGLDISQEELDLIERIQTELNLGTFE